MKNKQKGFIVPLLIGIIAVLVIAGGVYVYENKKAEAPVVSGAENRPSSSGIQTNSQAESIATGSQISPNVSVPGMTQYTDSTFGFSFWYPSSWVTGQPSSQNQYISISGGTLEKSVMVGPAGDLSNSILIQEFSSPGFSITDKAPSGPAGNGSLSLTYYFDSSVRTWMAQDTDGLGHLSTFAANVTTNTMGGLHILGGNARFGDDVIIPLSASHFLVVSSVEAGTIQERLFAQTITATDPAVATPVSADQQIKAIHTEGLLYGALGTIVPSWGYTDSQYVYDSQGNILVGANPVTFRAINTYSDGFNAPTGFATDGVHIYYDGSGGGELLAGADPATFVVIRQSEQIPYAQDSGKYGQSFSSAYIGYEKDATHVWDHDKLVPGADPNTFVVTGDAQVFGTNYDFSKGITLAHDAHHVYGEDAKGNVTVDGVTVVQ